MKPCIYILTAAAFALAACREATQPTSSPNLDIIPGVNLPPLADAGGPYTSDGGEVRFDGSGSFDLDGDTPLTYAWDFGDGSSGTEQAPTHTYAADGRYTVTLVVTDARGMASLPDTTTATASNVPKPEIVLGAGNIATCGTDNDAATALVLDGQTGTVMPLGDNTLHGTAADYASCYDPTWGRHQGRSYSVMGNHEYGPGTADPTFDYFGDRAGPRDKGYYSFDLGAWHVIVLNDMIPFGSGSEQEVWLRQDLAANTKRCTLAAWHAPRFLSSQTTGFTDRPSRKILWDDLYAAGADLVLNAQQHHYERLAPMDPAGNLDPARGIREFNVGTGGQSVELPTVAIHPNSEVRGAAFGVIKLTLRVGGYDWEFLAIGGQSFTDSGSGTCH
ncbi:MAG: PKD domain-containing protein [Gemmatimonadetes bacterium]|nr:PKD domain-containing protein [Gemmatimonadota bacterium]